MNKMHYVKVRAPANAKKMADGKSICAQWGHPDADAHFGHITEEGNIPAYAAADLVAAGFEILEINTIHSNYGHVSVGHTDISKIDVREELQNAPDQEIHRYLMHHNAMPLNEFHTHKNVRVREPQPDGTHRRVHKLVPNPQRPSPDVLRARALAIHDAKGQK